jgi:hypothetical protein
VKVPISTVEESVVCQFLGEKQLQEQKVRMAKIALGIHLESSVNEIQYSIRSLNDRLTAQQSLLHELQQFYENTTTKAELHAAMACLTYKNMGLALPSNSLHDIIKDKFAKSEQIRPSEVKGYLANPFEALASMGKFPFSLLT